MREPRPKQLFPTGGKNLYELLRSDHEPVMIDVFPQEECQKGRDTEPDTLVYGRSFDPMLYFWPVEGQHVLVHFNTRPPELERLVKALQRDGAAWVTVAYKKDKKPTSFYSPEWNAHDDADLYAFESFGDADGFIRRRYGPAVMDLVAVPERGGGADRESAEAGPTAPGRIPDGQRQDFVGDGAPLAGPRARDDGDVHGSAARTAATNCP